MRCRHCGDLIGNFSLLPDDAPTWVHLIGMQNARCRDDSGNHAEPEEHSTNVHS